MERWDTQVREDHEALEAQMGALEAALTIDVGQEDRRVVLKWIVRTLWPALELHLRKEEEILFPALQNLLGNQAQAIALLKQQHGELRSTLRQLAELLQGDEGLDWEKITLSGRLLIDLLEDHEKKEDRLLIDVLEFSLKPKELLGLAGAFQQISQKAYTEEGWPGFAWPRKDHSRKVQSS